MIILKNMTFEKEWSSPSCTASTFSKHFLSIDLINRFFTADNWNISERLWRQVWYPYKSLDLPVLFKNMTFDECDLWQTTQLSFTQCSFWPLILEISSIQMTVYLFRNVYGDMLDIHIKLYFWWYYLSTWP